jgi:uncharacterized protein YgiB involved in biofilm formation
VLVRELRRASEQADAKAAATVPRCQAAANLASIPVAAQESCQSAALWVDRDERLASGFIPLRQGPALSRLTGQEALPAPLRHQVLGAPSQPALSLRVARGGKH